MPTRCWWRGLGVMIGVVGISGCWGTTTTTNAPAAKSFRGVRLQLGMASPDDPAELLTVLGAARGDWEARHGATVVLAPGGESPTASDVLVFRADRVGDLIDQGRLAPIPDELVRPPAPPESVEEDEAPPAPVEDRFALSDILPAYRDEVCRYGGDLIGLPVGGSGLVLVYRRDLFEKPEAQQAAESAGVALEPPETYDELDALAKFLHEHDIDGDGQPEGGIALALGTGPEGVADAIALARAAALGLHPDAFGFLFDDETFEPWVARPPFVEALKGLSALAAHGPEGMARFDAEAARAAFRSGKAAMLIDRADRASTWTDTKKPIAVGVASLPGSSRVFDPDRKVWQTLDRPNRPTYLPWGGGWLLGLSSSAQGERREAALDLIKDMTGQEASGRLIANRDFPLLPTRTSLLGIGMPDPRSAPGVDARSWGRAVTETLTAPRVVPGLRAPEASGYLSDFAQARAAVLAGGSAEAALKAVETAWRERTARLSAERQLWHYRRGLHRPTRTASPPERRGEPSS